MNRLWISTGLALLVAASAATAADVPRISAERNAILGSGDDLIMRVKCLEPVSGRYCQGRLRLNGAVGGGSGARAAGDADTVYTTYSVREGETKGVHFGKDDGWHKLGNSLTDRALGSTSDELRQAIERMKAAQQRMSEVHSQLEQIMGRTHALAMAVARRENASADVSRSYRILRDAEKECDALSRKLSDLIEQGFSDGDQRELENLAERMKEATAKVELIIYLGNGLRKTVIVNLRG